MATVAERPTRPATALEVALGALRRIALAAGGLLTFIYGILLMKETAGIARDLFPDFMAILAANPVKAMGFGWGAAYLVLSGSPIAALGLGLLDRGVLTPLATYAFIMGSRLGAAILTILVGLVAWLGRKQDRYKSLSIGVLSFLVTYSIYAPAILLGWLLVASGWFGFLTFQAPAPVLELLNGLFAPLVRGTIGLFRGDLRPLAFLASVGLIYLGFTLFDAAFYREEVAELKRSRVHELLRNPYFSFALGAAVTLVAESVSISLGILVPLFLRGYLDTDEVIPYIMGANVTTFGDTLFAALLLNNPNAVNIVLIEILSVAFVSAIALRYYGVYHGGLRRAFDFVMDYDAALVAFVAALVAAPILLLFL